MHLMPVSAKRQAQSGENNPATPTGLFVLLTLSNCISSFRAGA
jgi:hypothetical protein